MCCFVCQEAIFRKHQLPKRRYFTSLNVFHFFGRVPSGTLTGCRLGRAVRGFASLRASHSRTSVRLYFAPAFGGSYHPSRYCILSDASYSKQVRCAYLSKYARPCSVINLRMKPLKKILCRPNHLATLCCKMR